MLKRSIFIYASLIITGLVFLSSSCKKADPVIESNFKIYDEFTVTDPGSGSCFGNPCTSKGANCSCPGFYCCSVRDAVGGEYSLECRKPGNNPIPHFVFGGFSNLTNSQADFAFLDVLRIHNSDTTQVGSNIANDLDGKKDMVFLDDDLDPTWANDNVTYIFKFKDEYYQIFDSQSWSGTVN
jgi:hypothetical protein